MSAFDTALKIDHMEPANRSIHTLIAEAVHTFEPAKQMTPGERCDLAILLRTVVEKAHCRPKSVEEDRVEFEAWFAQEKGLTEELAAVAFLPLQSDPRYYHCWDVQAAWKLWLGARGRTL